MARITTRPANLTPAQSRTMLKGGQGVREVLVDGQVVGQYAKNKHGITIGHFDPQALTADENPFVAARTGYRAHPASRIHGRTVKQLVQDIANRVPATH